MSTTMILTNLVIGPLLLILAIIFKAFPPKKRNWVYGYRTHRSMKSQESWDAANKYSTELMLWVAIITTIFQIVFYFIFTPSTALLLAASIMCVLLVGMLVVVEKYLKDNFDAK